MKQYYLCMEIGGTNLRYGVVDKDFHIMEFHKIATEFLSDAKDKGKYIHQLLKPEIEKYGHENLICLTLSLASLMDVDRTVCYSSPNIRGFNDLELPVILQSEIGIPVYMERDVNTALLYDIRKRNCDPSGIIIGVYIGTGLGNAMCINGKVYKGSTGSSCELGHMPVPGLTEPCGCGKSGCIELTASGKALEKLSSRKFTSSVHDVFKYHAADDEVRKIVYMCALAAAAEITILDPKIVFLGGGVVGMDGFPIDYFTETVKSNLRTPNPRKFLNLIPASSDPEAGLVGAAINASKCGRQ